MTQLTLADRAQNLRDREPTIRQALEKWRDIRARGLRNAPQDVRIRHRFVRLDEAAPSGSDRILPPRTARPPATRLVTSQGSLLKFELVVLAEAQLHTRPGRRPENQYPLMRDQHTFGWADLLALDPVPSDPESRRTYEEAADLRRGQITRTVKKLMDKDFLRQKPVEEDGGKSKKKSIDPEKFLLQDEGGPPISSPRESNIPYLVPAAEDTFFTMPYNLVENGWLHVLPESALAMILLAAHRPAAYPHEAEGFQLSGYDRVRWYGISPDTYGRHDLLSNLGIFEVTADPSRKKLHPGIAPDKRRSLPHSIKLNPDAFDDDAITRMLRYLT